MYCLNFFSSHQTNRHIVRSLTMMDFHDDTTINHKNKTIVTTIVLYTISLCFSGFKIRRLVAQIVDIVKMTHAWASRPWHRRFRPTTRPFWPRKIMVAGIQSKVNNYVTIFSLSTFSEFWAARIIIVAAMSRSDRHSDVIFLALRRTHYWLAVARETILDNYLWVCAICATRSSRVSNSGKRSDYDVFRQFWKKPCFSKRVYVRHMSINKAFLKKFNNFRT